MGAWGYKPNENDESADEYSLLMRKLGKYVVKTFDRKKPDSSERFARVGMIYSLFQHSPGLASLVRQTVLADITFLLKDKEWLSTWKDEKAIVQELKKFRKQLSTLKLIKQEEVIVDHVYW